MCVCGRALSILFSIDTMGRKPHKNRFIMHALQDIMRITNINIFISVFGIPTEKKAV